MQIMRAAVSRKIIANVGRDTINVLRAYYCTYNYKYICQVHKADNHINVTFSRIRNPLTK